MVKEDIKKKVHNCYWRDGLNCATTMLKVLEGYFKTNLNNQVIHSAVGMHGAGRYGAQCGLVEAALLFIGIYGYSLNIDKENIVESCRLFADEFNRVFSSLNCSELRPGGFNKEDPEHLCEELTVRAGYFIVDYIIKRDWKKIKTRLNSFNV